jgi:hypothetical protein
MAFIQSMFNAEVKFRISLILMICRVGLMNFSKVACKKISLKCYK